MKANGALVKLNEMMRGFWNSSILFAGLEVGLYELLAKRPATLTEVIRRLETDPRATEILLNALVALGILHKTGSRYALDEAMADALVHDRPGAQTSLIAHLRHMWDSWGHLGEVLRTGRPWRNGEEGLNPVAEERQTRAFIEAMHQASLPSAREFARRIDLSDVDRVLDIGGGPGTYCIEMARRKPGLHAEILDRQLPLQIARRYIAAAGLEEAIQLRVGDALRFTADPVYDLVLLSQLLHAFSFEQNRQLVQRAAEALKPGGMMIIQEFSLNDDKTSPAPSALFAVNMLVNTEGGRTYTAREITGWMKQAGLRDIRTEDMLGRSTLFLARKSRRPAGKASPARAPARNKKQAPGKPPST